MEEHLNNAKAAPAHRAMAVLQTNVYDSGLDPLLLELVKMRASQINGCAYCLDMHSKDARAMGESEQRLYELNAWREAPFYTERERAGRLPGRFRRPRCRPAMTPVGYPQVRRAGCLGTESNVGDSPMHEEQK